MYIYRSAPEGWKGHSVTQSTNAVMWSNPCSNRYSLIFFPTLQNPFTDNSELQQRTARMLSLNTWDVAVALTNLEWTIFDSVHEVCPINPVHYVALSQYRPARHQPCLFFSTPVCLYVFDLHSKNSSISPSLATVTVATQQHWSCCCSTAMKSKCGWWLRCCCVRHSAKGSNSSRSSSRLLHS